MDNIKEQITQDPLDIEYRKTANLIAKKLNETKTQPRMAIYDIVKNFGIDRSLNFLEQTQQIEKTGGLLLPDKSRKRTPGGVFFRLVKNEGDRKILSQIFPYMFPYKERKLRRLRLQQNNTKKPPRISKVVIPRFKWNEIRKMLKKSTKAERGVATTVKIIITGRPKSIITRSTCVIITLQGKAKLPSIPKGVPIPSPGNFRPPIYTLYIATKQWGNIPEALKDPEDYLVAEGFPYLDKTLPGGFGVLVQSITTQKTRISPKKVLGGTVQDGTISQ